jgi:oligoendopeptidase F
VRRSSPATSRYEVAQRTTAELRDRPAGARPFAPISTDTQKTPWDEARRIVVGAYNGFSERPAASSSLLRRAGSTVTSRQAHGRVLSPFSVHPHPHELHRRPALDLTLATSSATGSHGVLAQPLGLFHSSTPLTAETASVFGEALTFELLLANEDDPKGASTF